jgi:hypothetical protein
MLLRITSSSTSTPVIRAAMPRTSIEVVVRGQGEVAQPAAAVEDFDLPAEGAQARVVEHVPELLEELVDLGVLRPHGRPDAAVAREDAEGVQEAVSSPLREGHVLDAVVRRRCFRRGCLGLPPTEEELALPGRADVDLLSPGREVNAGEADVEDLAESVVGVLSRGVLGDVLFRVEVRELQVPSAAEFNGPDDDAGPGRRGGAARGAAEGSPAEIRPKDGVGH